MHPVDAIARVLDEAALAWVDDDEAELGVAHLAEAIWRAIEDLAAASWKPPFGDDTHVLSIAYPKDAS